MLKLKLRFEAKCKRHPMYDPAKGGMAGVKGGCMCCTELFVVHTLRNDFLELLGKREEVLVKFGAKIVKAGGR